MIENIVVGSPICSIETIFGKDIFDWLLVEQEKTVYETERFLPKLLVKYGFFKSTSEIKRNRMDLWVTLDKLDFIEIKIGKKKLWIVAGN